MLKKIGLACAFAMLVCSGTASAQDRLSERITANAMVAFGTSRAGVSTDAKGVVGFKAREYVSINLEAVSLSFRPYTENRSFKKRALDIGGTVRFTLESNEYVRSYVSIGMSSVIYENRANDNVQDVHPNLALGAEFWLTRYLGVGFDVRSMFIDNGPSHYFMTGIILGAR